MQIVDQPRREVLADGRHPAAETDVLVARRRLRLPQRRLDAVGHEVKGGAALHLDGVRAWCVSTKVGTWYGGSSPHQPFQVSSGHGPRTGPNMFRPRIHAPTFRKLSSAMRLSTPVSPPAPPCIAWKARVGNTHSMIS